MLPNLFNITIKEVKLLVQKTSSVAVTTDLWTSLTTSSFMAITIHYWDDDSGILCSKTVECCRFSGKHAGEAIAEKMEFMKEFELREKIPAITSDNCANMVKAVRLVNKTYIPCFAHKLNLVVTDALDAVPGVGALRDKVSATVALMKRSSSAKECLEECERLLGVQPFKPLIQGVVTRWNSFYKMLHRFQKFKDSLMLFFGKMSSENQLSPEEWELVSALVTFLEPCFKATEEMSGEKYVTGSKVIPLIKSLTGHYAETERALKRRGTKAVEIKVCSEILSKFNIRFSISTVEGVKELALAALLDPRFKHHSFRDKEKKDKALSRLKQELGGQVEESEAPKKSLIWGFLETQMERQRNVSVAEGPERELSSYLAEPMLEFMEDPLTWWKKEESKYKKLSQIAFKYLVIPGTSILSERVFSDAGNIATKKRSCLSDENVNMLVCLKSLLQNYDMLSEICFNNILLCSHLACT